MKRRKNLCSNSDKNQGRDEEIEEIEIKIGVKLLEEQRKTVEKELDEMKEARKRGNCGAVFKLKARVTGEKKEGAEAVVIKDPANGNLIYDPDKIKTASLEYCKDLLKDKKT